MRCIVICVKVYLLFFAISSVNLYSDSGQTRKHPFIKHQLQTINFLNSFRFCLSCTVLREKMADVRPSHRPELVSGTVDSCRPRYFTSICDGEMKVAISFRRSAARPVRYCHVPGASRSTECRCRPRPPHRDYVTRLCVISSPFSAVDLLAENCETSRRNRAPPLSRARRRLTQLAR